MRPIAGLLAFISIVLIAVIMLISEWIKKRKKNKRNIEEAISKIHHLPPD
jgi:hypothetical protein